MSEIKLNQWTWGVVPKLPNGAVVITGGDVRNMPTKPWITYTYCKLCPKGSQRWYAVLSLGPPEMPKEELRLPEGWEVVCDAWCGANRMIHVRLGGEDMCSSLIVYRPTRAECVREINRLLEGK